jgi:phosphatidylserine decarboxylase
VKTIAEWKATDVARMEKIPQARRDTVDFYRQPARPQYSNPLRMYSPADGCLIYCTHVKSPDERLLDTKGVKTTVRELTRMEELEGGFWVAGVFMSQYDVHANTMPYAGNLEWKHLPSITTQNQPMLETEKGLLKGIVCDCGDFQHANQRMLNTVYSAALDYKFYMVQLADYDVDCITPFSVEQNVNYSQTQRFSFIRLGSQCDLILPDCDHISFKPLYRPIVHVEAGIDTLFEVEVN